MRAATWRGGIGRLFLSSSSSPNLSSSASSSSSSSLATCRRYIYSKKNHFSFFFARGGNSRPKKCFCFSTHQKKSRRRSSSRDIIMGIAPSHVDDKKRRRRRRRANRRRTITTTKTPSSMASSVVLPSLGEGSRRVRVRDMRGGSTTIFGVVFSPCIFCIGNNLRVLVLPCIFTRARRGGGERGRRRLDDVCKHFSLSLRARALLSLDTPECLLLSFSLSLERFSR